MSLREAIVLGEAWPQSDRYIGLDENGNVCEACVVGGAALAAGISLSKYEGSEAVQLVRLYPELSKVVECPECGQRGELFYIIAIHLGTSSKKKGHVKGRWTRQAVVAWLDERGITQPPATDAEHEERETDVTRRTTCV